MRPPLQRNPYAHLAALACLAALFGLGVLIVATSEPVQGTYVGGVR